MTGVKNWLCTGKTAFRKNFEWRISKTFPVRLAKKVVDERAERRTRGRNADSARRRKHREAQGYAKQAINILQDRARKPKTNHDRNNNRRNKVKLLKGGIVQLDQRCNFGARSGVVVAITATRDKKFREKTRPALIVVKCREGNGFALVIAGGQDARAA